MSYLAITFLFSPDYFDILYSLTDGSSLNDFSYLITQGSFKNLKSEVLPDFCLFVETHGAVFN